MTEQQKQVSSEAVRKRERVDRLVDIYINDLDSLSKTAGWHQEGLLSLMITYSGYIPKGSGNDQSNLSSIMEIRWIREPHALLPIAKELINNLLRLDEPAAVALIASRFYRNLYTDPDTKTVKIYKDTTRAKLIGQDPRCYRKNLKRGYDLAILAHSLIQAGYDLGTVSQMNKKRA